MLEDLGIPTSRVGAPRTPGSPGSLKRTFDRRSNTDDETVMTSTDGGSSTYQSSNAKFIYAPSKSDILPLILFILSTLVCVAIALITYFVVLNTSRSGAVNQLNSVGARSQFVMQHAIDSTSTFVAEMTSLFAVTDGNIANSTQFMPFVYGNNGKFPDNMQRLYYVTYVPPNNVSTFIPQIRTNGGNYANFNMTARDASGVIPYFANQTMYLPVTYVSPILTTSLTLLGFDHYSDLTRVPIINRAISTRQVVASTQLVAAQTTGPVQRGVLQYSPAFSQTNGNLLGFVVPVFETSVLVASAEQIYKGTAYLSLMDTNATDPQTAFMYSTNVNANDSAYSWIDNMDYIRKSQFVSNFTLTFGDRVWQATLIPTTSFLTSAEFGFDKYIGIIVAVILWLVCICVVSFLVYYKRLRATARLRVRSEYKIKTLSMFIPSAFLDLIRSKSIRNYIPGWNKTTKITLMAVVLDNFGQLTSETRSETVMDSMNEMYTCVKTCAKKNDGFIHRFEGVTFTLIFTNEAKAFNAAIAMQGGMKHNINVHVVLHNATVLAGIMGDVDSMMTTLITDQTDCLKKLSILCRETGKKVIMSREFVESIDNRKRNVEKLVTYVGRIETLPLAGVPTFTDAYQLLDENDPIKPAVRRRYGDAMKKKVTRDYLGALDLLEALIESDRSDSKVRKMYDNTSRTISLCRKVAEVWNVQDTLREGEILRPAFQRFCKLEASDTAMNAWNDMLVYRTIPTKDRAYDLYAKYCMREDKKSIVRQELVIEIERKISEDQYETTMFDDVIFEMELLVTEAHNRFKKSPMFLNGMYSIMVNA